METKAAIDLIKKTFNAGFSIEQYNLFLRNLLNGYDEQKGTDWTQGENIPESFKAPISRFKLLGVYTDPDGNEVELLVIETKTRAEPERSSASLRNFVVKRLKDANRDYALAAFFSKEDNGADWRFSYIRVTKRFSFLAGEREHFYTAQKQLLPVLRNGHSNPAIKELENCFNIESVTHAFFGQYKALYLAILGYFNADAGAREILANNGIDTSRFSKKLLGQIVFVYFLQKKGWPGVPKNEPRGKGEGHNYFKDYLQPLFYEGLMKVSFGGLFKADYDWRSASLSLPDSLFRNAERNKTGGPGTGILDVFDRYNFTIKEGGPQERDMAVDPEMLGTVFENMLGVTERKNKGAFYTPREVVHYMCQESLIDFLDNAVNEISGDRQRKTLVPLADIECFIRRGSLTEPVRFHADVVDRHLTNIKICDPAIGSGAFPVGLLHELAAAENVLLPYLSDDYLHEKLTKIGLGTPDFKNDPSKYSYGIKRHILQESIYGVDVDALAIDVARLRLWLFLIVDEEDPYSLEALPKLDRKIVQGNSLVGLPFEFELLFPEVWQCKSGFDIIIGNPPYVFTRDVAFSDDFKRIINENFISKLEAGKRSRANQAGKINLFAIFLLQGLFKTNEKGNVSFILPNNILRTTSYDKIRKYLLENGRIRSIVDLGSGVFKNVTASTIILRVENRQAPDHNIRIVNDIVDLESRTYRTKEVLQAGFLNNTSYAINILVDSGSGRIIDKIKSGSSLLGDYCADIIEGIVAHKHLITEEQAPHSFPLVEGKTIKRYYLESARKYIKWDVKEIHRKRPGYLWEADKKIVIQRISGGMRPLVAALDTNRLKTFASVNNLVLKERYDEHYAFFLALINSDLINWYYSINFSNQSDLTVNISKTYLEILPVKGLRYYKEIGIVVEWLIHVHRLGGQGGIRSFFEALVNSIIFEVYFEVEVQKAGKEIVIHLGELKVIDKTMGDDEVLAVIWAEFDRLNDVRHPVRRNMETLDRVEEIGMIKEMLK
jgi:type I restriction-modification system DNA methylase subunit